MRIVSVSACVLLAALLFFRVAPLEANPLFLPQAEGALPLLSAAESEGLKKDAELLQRKAGLLKAAAEKKYAAARELRNKAGVLRTDSSKQGDALRSKAQQSAEMSSLIGDMFGILSSMGGMSGMGTMTQNAMVAQSLTGQMIQGQQSADAKALAGAQMAAGQLSSDAEKKAGPLEIRADELENEGNRLMEANNRLVGIANAKSLLAASDEMLKKIDAESRNLERLKESGRRLASSPSNR